MPLATATRARVVRDNEADRPFESLAEQMRAVLLASEPGGRLDPRLRRILDEERAAGMSESVASDGGFLVDHPLQEEVRTRMYQTGEILSRVSRYSPTVGNGAKIPVASETSRANGSRQGGILSYWGAEADSVLASDGEFALLDLELKKLLGLVYATDELVVDSDLFGQWAERELIRELIFRAEDAIVNGTGAGRPLGILNAGATIEVAKEGSQDADTIVLDNLSKMKARLFGRRSPSIVWLVNQDAEPQLEALDSAGVFTYANGVSPYAYLLGFPVIPVEYTATLGDRGDIILADLGEYVVADRDPKLVGSIHVRFIYAERAFRFTYRVDGQPAWSVPVTPKNGTATQSPFVTLAERA